MWGNRSLIKIKFKNSQENQELSSSLTKSYNGDANDKTTIDEYYFI